MSVASEPTAESVPIQRYRACLAEIHQLDCVGMPAIAQEIIRHREANTELKVGMMNNSVVRQSDAQLQELEAKRDELLRRFHSSLAESADLKFKLGLGQ